MTIAQFDSRNKAGHTYMHSNFRNKKIKKSQSVTGPSP